MQQKDIQGQDFGEEQDKKQSNPFANQLSEMFNKQNEKDYYFFHKNLTQNQIYNQFCQDIFPPQDSIQLFKTISQKKNEEQFSIQQKNTIDSQQQNYEQKQLFLKRNRQNAKNSRQRKKIYYEQLQKKNKENQKKIKELTYKLTETELQLNRLKNNSNKRAQSFLQVINQCVDKLVQMLKPQSKYQKKALEQYCLELKSKYGPAGKFRADLLNYLMSQYMEHLLGDFQKYFMLSSLYQRGLFGKSPQNQLDLDVRQILQIDQSKKAKIIKKYGKCYRDAVNQFKQIRQRLYKCHVDLASYAKSIETAFHPMKKQISSATNFSKLIIFFNKNVHRQDIRQLKQQWFSSFIKDLEDNSIDKIYKKVKLNQDQGNS